jgi:hypothetical protein
MDCYRFLQILALECVGEERDTTYAYTLFLSLFLSFSLTVTLSVSLAPFPLTCQSTLKLPVYEALSY